MKKCIYDYKNSCTCAEDDKCGCDYDNNIPHDFSCNFEEKEMIKNKENQQCHPSLSRKRMHQPTMSPLAEPKANTSTNNVTPR